ncbi:MAG: DUF4292 domain-containing protein [Calditrichia bacterium]|nr:DUF4292 domain-containing protein [Calditrichia bacterium]
MKINRNLSILHFVNIIIFISIFSLLSSGCITFGKLRAPEDKNVFFEGKTQITITSPEMSFNFSANIQFTLKDSFHIAVKGPFGISAGDVYIINNRFIYINKLERIVLSGENDDGLLESVFQIPINPAILSKLALIPHLIKEKQLTGESYLNFENVKLNKMKQVTSTTLINPEGNINFSFDNFKKENNIYFPHKILLKHENTQQYLQISFKNIKKVNKKFPELPVIDSNYNQL